MSNLCTKLRSIRRVAMLPIFLAGTFVATKVSAQTLNVRNYGITEYGDQTARINNLIRNNPGKTLYFPAGRYKVSTVLIQNNIVLQGAAGAVIAPYSSSSTAGRLIDIRKGTVTFTNMTFDGGKIRPIGIYISNISGTYNFNMSGCKVTNIMGNRSQPGYGIQLNRNFGSINIQNTQIISVGGPEDGVIGNSLGANRGIYINNVKYVTINGCTFDYIKGAEDGDCIHSYRWDGKAAVRVAITNNTFKNIPKRAIKLHAGNAIVTGNKIYGLYDWSRPCYAAISAFSSNNQIKNNTISLYRSFTGVELTGRLSNNVLSGNNITIKNFSHPTYHPPIVVSYLAGTSISSNIFNGSTLSIRTVN